MRENNHTSRSVLSDLDLSNIDTLLLIMNRHSELLLLIARQLMANQADELAGEKYARNSDLPYRRHGYNPTHMKVGKEKLKTEVPRLRHRKTGETMNVPILEQLQNLPAPNDDLLQQMVSGLSMRDYASVVSHLTDSFGTSKSTLSREFIKESEALLEAFEKRQFEETYVAMFVDGKYLAGSQILIAVGVTVEGQKKILGFRESKSEHSVSIAELFRDLLSRGFKYETGFLLIADGAKGWHKAAREVFGEAVLLQRCQVHKIRNVLSYLSKGDQKRFEDRLKEAFRIEDYHPAKSALQKLADEIEAVNRSAAQSLREGLEETLTLHRLNIPPALRISFASTNPIESLNAELDRRLKKVKRYAHSSQKQRWVAVSLAEQETHLRKIRNHTQIRLLQTAIQKEVVSLISQTKP
jgi:transposase-like protein